MATVGTMSRKIGVNDLCYCGSGKKYKRCHRDIDEAARTASRIEDDAPAEHAHGLCETYRPVSRKRPAAERADFMLTLKRMRTEGRTVLHIEDPQEIARDQAQLDEAVSAASRFEVALNFRLDPVPEVLGVGQTVLDHLLGAGVYRLLPSGSSFKKYGQTTLRAGASQSLEILWTWNQSFGEVLMLAKNDEWSRRGMGGQPLSIAGAGGELLRDIIEQHQAIQDLVPQHAKHSPLGMFGVARLLSSVLAHYNQSDADGLGLAGHVAAALALGPAVESAAEWDALTLGMEEAAQHQLEAMRLESLGDGAALQITQDAPADWTSARGFADWIADLKKSGLTALIVYKPDGHTTGEEAVRTVTVDSSTSHQLLTVVPTETPAARLLEKPRSVFDVLEEVRAPVYATQNALEAERKQVLHEAEAKAEQRRILESQLKEVHAEEDRLQKASASLSGQIHKQGELLSTVHARALFDVLQRGAHEMSLAESRWQLLRADVGRAKGLLDADDSLRKDAQLVAEYTQMSDTGHLDKLPPTLRSLFEDDAEAARQRLGPILPMLKAPTTALATAIPLAVVLGWDGTVLRFGAAFPFTGAGLDSLLPDSLELAIVSAVASASKEILDMLEVGSDHAAVTHYSAEHCSLAWIEASCRQSEASVDAAADLYRDGIEEALAAATALDQAGVSLEVHLCTVVEFHELEEVMRLARA